MEEATSSSNPPLLPINVNDVVLMGSSEAPTGPASIESQSTPVHQVPVLQSPGSTAYNRMETPASEDRIPTERHSSAAAKPEASTPEQQVEDLMHGINSFWAIVTPVAITMILASFVAANYRSATLQASMSSYLVFDEDGGSSGGTLLGESLINALVIIGFVAVLTFAMVLLYKYNCMKFLVGYIMLASAAILGFEGGQLVDTILVDTWEWPVDWPSFLFVMANFAIVGVVAVFYQKGTSKIIQNGYLVLISVILAWQFSMWPEWTTWIFCSMFAVYDLCAVLTPCGPLKCLIGLIQEKQQPMPGLLYEADVRDGVAARQARAVPLPPAAAAAAAPQVPGGQSNNGGQSNDGGQSNGGGQGVANAVLPAAETYPDVCETPEAFAEQLTGFYKKVSPDDEWKAAQAGEKFFDKQTKIWPLLYHKYQICSCPNGTPCQAQLDAVRRAQRRQEEEDEDKTIKLGLGDFIFYSVLVARAALFDFSTLAAAFLCILMGLGATLFLLSVLHKALPALPFSIFLATFFYFWTRYTFVDYVDFIHSFPAGV